MTSPYNPYRDIEAPQLSGSAPCDVIGGVEKHPCYDAAIKLHDSNRDVPYNELSRQGKVATDVVVAAGELGTSSNRPETVRSVVSALDLFRGFCQRKEADRALITCLQCPLGPEES